MELMTKEEEGGGEEEVKKVSSGLKKSTFYQNLRHQLNEQLRNIESRLEAQLSSTAELQEYFKKRSEIEVEFSKMLDKMYKSCVNFKRKDPAQWSPSLLSNLMLNFLNETKKESKERLVLSEICGLIVNRLGLISEDLNRIFKQCQNVCLEGQEELIKVLQELYLSSKSYQSQNLEWKQAEAKLKSVESTKTKAEVGLSREKIEKSKKLKSLEKEVQKRGRKAQDTKFKAWKAKNEYIFCLDAANSAVQKYFVEDLSDLIDCMDLGYYESVASSCRLYAYAEEIKKESLASTIEQLNKILNSLDCRVDKQKFLEAHNSAFVLPKKFEFTQFLLEHDDTPPTLETPPILQEELEQRMYLLERRLCTLKIESNELWKTLETAESTLLSLIDENWSCNTVREWFAVGSITNALLSDGKEGSFKARSDRVETDQFHINKFRDFMLSTSRLARLDAKYDHIKLALGIKRTSTISDDEPFSSEKLKRRKRIGQRISSSCKLFGGSIEEYLEINKCDIPLIMKSCIRVVNLFGMHHQGIFRVSGSQVEINNFRDSFERGEDPLCELTDASDINSVASLLKLYLRELREPLFPIVFFDFFMEAAQLDNEQTFIVKMREMVTKNLPRPVFIVLRYLFHFLNHLSEYSEENMMDPYNLAICFGPTMVPVPEDKDQVQYQNLVNELIKNVIICAHHVFGSSEGISGGECYGGDNAENQPPLPQPTPVTSQEHSDSDSELSLNATALYDFKARSHREVNLKKGQKLKLVSRVSSDWWRGVVLDAEEDTLGLIPHKYIDVVVGGKEPPPTKRQKELPPPTEEPSEEPKASTSTNTSNTTTEDHHHKSHESKFTPDLVLDLPSSPSISTTSSTSSSSSSSTNNNADNSSSSDESEPNTVVTAAEVFAKQNQCTLKIKPKVMAKPKLPLINKFEKINVEGVVEETE